MQEQIRKVASRIRELREIAGHSPEEAARDLGIAGGAYLAYESLAPNFAHKRAEPFLVTVEPAPGGVAEQLNSHPGQEFTYVLSGEVKVVVGGHEVVLGEGDSLYFDASRDHGMTALGDAPARFLAVVL